MVTQRDLRLGDGRLVKLHDTGAASGSVTIVVHHGSPQTGALLPPVLAAAQERALRIVSYGRPGYGGSTPQPGRRVADAAADCAQIMDTLGIQKFATIGASGGGPHALACGALLNDRVTAVACLAGIAPFTDSFDWFAGMTAPDGLHSAQAGREARAEFEATAEFDADQFIDTDWAALAGAWKSLGADAGLAASQGPDGLVDDDVAFVRPWGFELDAVAAPALFVQGGADRVIPPTHADWLLRHCRNAELWLRPRDGHISVLDAYPLAMDWLRHL